MRCGTSSTTYQISQEIDLLLRRPSCTTLTGHYASVLRSALAACTSVGSISDDGWYLAESAASVRSTCIHTRIGFSQFRNSPKGFTLADIELYYHQPGQARAFVTRTVAAKGLEFPIPMLQQASSSFCVHIDE